MFLEVATVVASAVVSNAAAPKPEPEPSSSPVVADTSIFLAVSTVVASAVVSNADTPEAQSAPSSIPVVVDASSTLAFFSSRFFSSGLVLLCGSKRYGVSGDAFIIRFFSSRFILLCGSKRYGISCHIISSIFVIFSHNLRLLSHWALHMLGHLSQQPLHIHGGVSHRCCRSVTNGNKGQGQEEELEGRHLVLLSLAFGARATDPH